VDRMMPLKTKEFFNSVDTVVIKTILKTLQGYKNDMTQEVIRADKYSCQQYMLNEAAHQSNLSGKPSIHTHVVNAIKDAMEKNPEWKLNKRNVLRIPSREGVHTDGVFVNANAAMQATLAYLAGTNFAKIGNELPDFIRILSDIDWVKVYLTADGKNWLWPLTAIVDGKEVTGKYLFFDNTKRVLEDFSPEDVVDGWVGKKPTTYKSLEQPAEEDPNTNDVVVPQETPGTKDVKAEGSGTNNAIVDVIPQADDKVLKDTPFVMPDLVPASKKNDVSDQTKGTLAKELGDIAPLPVANDAVVPQEQEQEQEGESSGPLPAFGAEFTLRPTQRITGVDQNSGDSNVPAVTESNSTTTEVPNADNQDQILADIKQTGPAGEWIADQLNSLASGIILLGSTLIKQGDYYVIRKSTLAPAMAQRIQEGIQEQGSSHLTEQMSSKIQTFMDHIAAQRIPPEHNRFQADVITMESLHSAQIRSEKANVEEEQQELFGDSDDTDLLAKPPTVDDEDDDVLEYELPDTIVKEEFAIGDPAPRKRKSWRERQAERKADEEDELSMRINGLGKLTRSETLGNLAKQAKESLKALQTTKEAEASTEAEPKPLPDGYDPLSLNGINLDGVDEAQHRLNISKAIAVRLIDMIVDESGDWLVSPVERGDDGTLKTSVVCLKNLEVSYPKKFSVKVVIGLMRTQAKQRGFSLQKKHSQIILTPLARS
jgi:hypothetical protein